MQPSSSRQQQTAMDLTQSTARPQPLEMLQHSPRVQALSVLHNSSQQQPMDMFQHSPQQQQLAGMFQQSVGAQHPTHSPRLEVMQHAPSHQSFEMRHPPSPHQQAVETPRQPLSFEVMQHSALVAGSRSMTNSNMSRPENTNSVLYGYQSPHPAQLPSIEHSLHQLRKGL